MITYSFYLQLLMRYCELFLKRRNSVVVFWWLSVISGAGRFGVEWSRDCVRQLVQGRNLVVETGLVTLPGRRYQSLALLLVVVQYYCSRGKSYLSHRVPNIYSARGE